MQILYLPQVNRSVIINDKLVYTNYLTSSETTYNLGCQEIRKYLENLKFSLIYFLVLSPPPEMKFLSVLVDISPEKQKLNFSRSGLLHIKTRVYLKYFVNDCS